MQSAEPCSALSEPSLKSTSVAIISHNEYSNLLPRISIMNVQGNPRIPLAPLNNRWHGLHLAAHKQRAITTTA
jgi:hypothetical protein